MDALDEFYERNPSARGFLDNSTNEERKLLKIQMDKQNELMMLMNRVADKYVKWSLAKDHFIGEVMAYCQENTSKINTGERMVDYLYVIFSLLALYPLYIAFKKLLTPYDVYINLLAILLMMASDLFHLHVFHTGCIPFFSVPTSYDDFVFYSSIVLAILCNITFMIAHSRHYRKNKW